MDHTPEYRQRLKKAVDSEAVPPFLAARVQNALHSGEAPARPRRGLRLSTIGLACAALLVAGSAFYLVNLRSTISDQNEYIAGLTDRIGHLLGIGLGDHVHCSVFREYPDVLPSVEETSSNMPEEYRALVPVVRDHVPANYQLTLAHECRFNGRRFIHVSLKDGDSLASLVIARKQDGETFGPPALHSATSATFATAAFENSTFLIYFISDLPEAENVRLLTEMAPQIDAALL